MMNNKIIILLIIFFVLLSSFTISKKGINNKNIEELEDEIEELLEE